ncbi:MAG: hypothetical protein FJ271_19790 [Planctomycetes bacterium]|nr:hypothetical protein [Planctomycetota bacterium]
MADLQSAANSQESLGKPQSPPRPDQIPTKTTTLPPDLARIIDLWPDLPAAVRDGLARWPDRPDAIRVGILAMIGAASGNLTYKGT